MSIRIACLGAAVAALTWLLPVAAVAGEAASADNAALEEVVVTAERRSIDLQDTPLAVTVISGEDIARLGNADIAQILQDVPSLVMQNVTGGMSTQSVQGSGAPPNIAIRGLGTDGPNRAGAVAIYQDGILLQGGGGNSYDMSRVEVLRGPQGTLYGRGATAGAVNFITNEPGKEFAASGRIQFGSFGLVGTQGMLNVPFSDVLQARVAFNQVRRNGYFNNGQSDEDTISTRVKLRYSPSDRFSLTIGGVLYNSSSSSPGAVDVRTGPPTDWFTTLPGGTKSPNSYRKGYVDVEADLGFADLTYLGGFQTSHSYFSSFCRCFGNPAGTYVAVDSPYNETTTQELRLASKSDSALTWVAGAYHYHNRLQQQFRLSVLPPAVGGADSPFTTNLQHYSPSSFGLFGELSYAVSDATRLTAGVRQTDDHVVQDQQGNVGVANATPGTILFVDAKNHRFDWKARVEYDLSADHLLYGTVSTGYRPGAVVQGLISDIESVRAYELGSKNKLGSKMTVNAAAFYYDYSGFQNVLSQPVNNIVVTTVIAIPATFYGAEIEAAIQLSFNDKLTFAPAYVSARYTESCAACVVGMGSSAPSPLLTKNGHIPHTPGITASASYEHIFRLNGGARLAWGVDAHYQSEMLTDFDSSNYQVTNPSYATTQNGNFLPGKYTVFNSALTFTPEGDKYSITAYGRNLGNKIYKTAAANTGVPGGAMFVNDPKTIGLMLSAKL